MKKTILFLTLFFPFIVYSQCVTNVDFNTWSVAGNPANGNWVVQGGGAQVRQTVNGDNTYFISPFDLMNVRITGNFRSTDNDDDWMGFVFSFLNPMGNTNDFDCWLFDWKQEYQGAAPRGMSLNRILGTVTNYAPFNNHQNTAEFTVIDNTFGGPGWNRNFNHAFEIRLTYTRATIYVDGNLIFDHADCYKPGRFGFYNKSQEDCYYSNFQYDLFIDFFVRDDGRMCVNDTMDFEFVSPCVVANLSQYQSLTWNFGDGSPPLVNNNPTFANANVKHVYTTPGTYTATLTVLDFNGCSSTSTRTIEVRPAITLTPVLNQPPCNGGLNGSVRVNPSGGFGNYTYSWNGGVTNQQTWPVGAGTYTVYVTDGICSAEGQYTLNQPSPLTAVTSHTDATCGQNNGTATITISGGTPPYQNISWAGIPGNPATGLRPNYYIADFTDANGCSSLLQYRETVSQLPCGINTSVNKTNVSCFNGTNGSITLTITGGAANPNISWSNGSSGATINNLPAGTYTYTYTDAVPGNTFSGTVVITQPGAGMVGNLVTTPISCAGSNDGTAIASVTSGGVPPYSYAWSGGQPNNPVAQNLSPGPISVTITDASGCNVVASGTVSGTASLTANIVTTIDSCFNSGKGTATVTASGGYPPYSYSWNNFYSNFDNKNLRGGTYIVTVTDNKNCTATASGVVGGPSAPLTYAYTKQDIDCYGGNNGNFNINTSGGTPGYTIVWDAPGVSGYNPTGLVAGAYNYTITDSYGCIVYGGDTIKESDLPLSAVTSHTNVTCFGSNNGTITITIDGGTPPYTYLGNPIPAGITTIPNLAAGNYSGVVLDANNCSVSVSETITEPNVQNINVTGTDNPCFGATLGTATANFVNATGTVIYDWSNGQSGATINNLAAGNYIVTATDQNNCIQVGNIDITEPAQVTMLVDVTDATCFGLADGTATANPVGGTAPFVYAWSNGGSGQTINLPSGSYTVTATDAATCQQIASFVIGGVPEIIIQSQVVDVSCFGGNNGSITLNVSGGTGGFNYSWSPNVGVGNTITNLSVGNYGVTITDANSCSTTFSATVTEPSSIGLSATATDVACNGDNSATITTNVSGGASPFNYDLFESGVLAQNSGTGQFATLAAGTYSIVVTDGNSCLDSTTVVINEPVLLSASSSFSNVSCFGYGNGEIIVVATGGTPTLTYTISSGNQNTNGNFSGLGVGNYTITITDINNCETTVAASIEQPDAVLVSIVPDSATIDAGETISLDVVTNLTGTITYLWEPSTDLSCSDCSNPEFIGSTTTQYTVTSVNESGCSGSDNILIAVVPNYTIYIPNAFTPNGDGTNDTWKIFGNITGLAELEVLIFNRWGEKMFEGNLLNFEWDGTYMGKLMNPGIYVWHVNTKFKDGYTKNFKGSLTLVK
jgi:gliding motility-associated-like protein